VQYAYLQKQMLAFISRARQVIRWLIFAIGVLSVDNAEENSRVVKCI
jgi:hypothetical protein